MDLSQAIIFVVDLAIPFQKIEANMSKTNEVLYFENVIIKQALNPQEFEKYLLDKPFSDNRRGWYLMDIAQILKLLPPPPLRLLDIGIGSGWTSKIFATCGYEVVGVDIAPSMINLAKTNCSNLPNITCHVLDYEDHINFGHFDCAIVYDALHHALEEKKVIENVYKALKKGGIFLTVEPGKGHSQTQDSLEAMAKYGTTEKDMPFSLQKEMMEAVGFSKITQYYRLSELPLEEVTTEDKITRQKQHFEALSHITHQEGFTSIVIAIK